MLKKLIAISGLLAAASAATASGNLLQDGFDNHQKQLEAYQKDEADRRKNPIGRTLSDLEQEACGREMHAKNYNVARDPVQRFERLPDYACQAWYWSNKQVSTFGVAYRPVSAETYLAWQTSVRRSLLIDKKFKELSDLAAQGRALAKAPGEFPASVKKELAQYADLNLDPLRAALTAMPKILAPEANPLEPKPQVRRPATAYSEAELLGEPPRTPAPASVAAPDPAAEAMKLAEVIWAEYKKLPSVPLGTARQIRDFLTLTLAAQKGAPELAARLDAEVAEVRQSYPNSPAGLTRARDFRAWLTRLQGEPDAPAWIGEYLAKTAFIDQ